MDGDGIQGQISSWMNLATPQSPMCRSLEGFRCDLVEKPDFQWLQAYYILDMSFYFLPLSLCSCCFFSWTIFPLLGSHGSLGKSVLFKGPALKYTSFKDTSYFFQVEMIFPSITHPKHFTGTVLMNFTLYCILPVHFAHCERRLPKWSHLCPRNCHRAWKPWRNLYCIPNSMFFHELFALSSCAQTVSAL